ncbi:MAG: alpha/beta hydrolase [Ruminococcaceae bacterium]|nr:alpha/beta hydrolase [Oscillospiraceae bacterium]
MAELKTIQIQNGTVEVVKFGRGEEAFVILPGLSYDGFFEQAEVIESAYRIFTDRFTVYLIDRNKMPHMGYTVRNIAEDTAEVMEQLKIENACVFGASLGGMAAQELAIGFPKRVKKLVLGSTLSRMNAETEAVLSRWESLAANGKIDEMTADFYQTIYSAETLKRYGEVFSQIKTIATNEKTTRFLIYLNAGKRFDVLGSLGLIKAKTLVISAAGDRVTTAAGAKETAEALGCDYCEYPNFGHAVYDEAPDYKNRVFDFLIGG